jgi:phosphoribosyl 1,2-cyclic phosphodiesterase
VATPGKGTLRCGGNTPCIEVRCGSRIIVIDAGTGIRELGLKLAKEGVTALDLLFSHFHMDHTQGFPFFTPAYSEGTRIDIHAAPWAEHSIEEPFHKLMDQPSFPVPFRYMSADIQFHEMNGRSQIGDVHVRSQALNHPGGCIAFRMEYRGKSLIYLTDHEPYGNEQDREVRDFTRGADVLIREAQYTPAEYEMKRGWGHSRFDDAVSDAIEAGVKRLAIFHHDPEHDDQFLERELRQLQSRYGSSKLDISLAREGQSIELA